MPLTAGGKLTIVASANLGELGSQNGLPVTYEWVLPGVAPLLLPWLAILGLLALKPNRSAGAWLIWLPLGCVFLLTLAPPSFLPAGTNFLLDAVAALAVGLAAVWLLSNYLRRKNRLLTFLSVLLALAGFSMVAGVARQGWNLLEVESLQIGIVLAVGVLASAVALNLAGLICRRRYNPNALYLWLLVLLIGVWLVITLPFFLIAMMAKASLVEWSEFFIPVLSVATVNFVTLLPFLILSSASPLFRERLRTLLHVKPETPPVMAPLPEAALKL